MYVPDRGAEQACVESVNVGEQTHWLISRSTQAVKVPDGVWFLVCVFCPVYPAPQATTRVVYEELLVMEEMLLGLLGVPLIASQVESQEPVVFFSIVEFVSGALFVFELIKPLELALMEP